MANPHTYPATKLPRYLQYTPLGAVIRAEAGKAMHAAPTDPVPRLALDVAQTGDWGALGKLSNHLTNHPEHPVAKLFDWNTVPEKVGYDVDVYKAVNDNSSLPYITLHDMKEIAAGKAGAHNTLGGAVIEDLRARHPEMSMEQIRASATRLLARESLIKKHESVLGYNSTPAQIDRLHDQMYEAFLRHRAKQARMKAPKGGMIVNNTYSPGGQFLAGPLKKIRSVVTAWARKRAKLGRESAATYPGHLPNVMYAAGFDPKQEKLTVDQLRSIEDAHGIPDSHRLSNKPKATRKDRERFFDALVSRRMDTPILKKKLLLSDTTDPESVFNYIVPHLVAGSHFYAGVQHGALDWYGKDIDKLEKGVHKILGPDFHPGSPHHTLLKALIAATSSGQEPVQNVRNAIRMMELAYAADPKDPWSHIPHNQVDRLRGFLRTAGPGALNAGLTPAEWHQWYLAHANEKKYQITGNNPAPYSVRPAVMVNRPNHPDHEKVVSYEAGRNNWVTMPGMGKYLNKKLPRGITKRIPWPVVDAEGNVKAKSWTQQDSKILSRDLDGIKHIVHHFGGDIQKVKEWLLTDHSRENFQQVTGKDLNDKDEVLGKDDPVPGMFFLGPKKGAFALNLHQNEDSKHGRFLTADVWWTRTWNRLQGTLFNLVTGKSSKAIESPRSPRERKLMWEAAKRATSMAGLRSVADLQANLWYMEQHLDRWFGGDASSTSVVDGINAALQDRGMKLKLARLTASLQARADKLAAAGKILPPGRLMLIMLKAYQSVFDPHRIKLSRDEEQPRAKGPHWQKPDGTLISIAGWTHHNWAKQQGLNENDMLRTGWNRIQSEHPQTLWVDRFKSAGPLTSAQRRELIDHAISLGYHSIIQEHFEPKDGRNISVKQTIWSRPDDEPERLSRPLLRQQLERHRKNPDGINAALQDRGIKLARGFANSGPFIRGLIKARHESIPPGSHTLHNRDQHNSAASVLADRFADEGDPREELIRENHPTNNLFPDLRGKAGADRAEVHTYPYLLPDKTNLAIHRASWEGGTPAWAVVWHPTVSSVGPQYRKLFTHDEFRNWLKKWPADQIRAFIRTMKTGQYRRDIPGRNPLQDPKLRFSRPLLRQLLQKHRAAPDGLRQLAVGNNPALKSFLHYAAGRLAIGHSPEQIENDMPAWQKKRGYTSVRLARGRTTSYWINPQGQMHEVGDFQHDAWAQQNHGTDVAGLQSKGWGRVVGSSDMLMFDPGMDRRPANAAQLREMTNHAIENGYNHVWHAGTDRPLWSKPNDEIH